LGSFRDRTREFGVRHPVLARVIACALVAGLFAVCCDALSHGTYLGRSWLICAVAGMVTAVGLGAAALISNRRNSPATGWLGAIWAILGFLSLLAIRFPFLRGTDGQVQAIFNGAHGALLGYAAVTYPVIIAVMAYPLVVHFHVRSRSQGVRTGQAPLGRAVIPARLRFPEAQAATWRDGRLIAANGRVTWLSRNGDVEVDLTAACQGLLTVPADGRKRQPRTTTLSTADNLAEVDVSPRALAALTST
jgi:hypothetical protein